MNRTSAGAVPAATETLAAAIARELGAEPEGLRRLSGGASRETWSFDADGRGWILQRRRPGANDGASPTTMSLGVPEEAAVLRAAKAAGVPVSAVVATGDGTDDGFGGPWMIVERAEGETLPKVLLTSPTYEGVRAGFAGEAGRTLARIHSIPLAGVGDLLPGGGGGPIGGLRRVLDGLAALCGLSWPSFELALRWLELNPPPERPDAVVHGDFRTGNLLVCPDSHDRPGLSAVLDWELCHVGNPVEDLGWFCVRAWRFGQPGRAGGFGPAEDLIEGYRRAGGAEVTLDELAWWELLGTVRWGVVCGVQVASHLTGAVSSVELAAIGRRAAEVEWDTLVALGELAGWGSPGAVDAPGSGAALPTSALHGRPDALELLAAVRSFLRDEVVPGTSGHLSYHARVAANVVAIVERELGSGTSAAEAHAAALHSVGVSDEAELARRVRDGAFDDRLRDVAVLLWPAVNERVAVSNPRYRDV